mmetsp:Transcript_28968/g.76428  ORF Transcript_28968/g.76428 Transcript_28968/m.76428 type:complete len:191 (-) Transcript_28968:163-735(-)
MAMITGGLGGLGLLAANELASAGCPFVLTTSRTGRPAAMQPQLLNIMEKMQHNSIHYMVRCDVSDGSAVQDLFASMSKPKTLLDDQVAQIEELIGTLRKKMDAMPSDTLAATLHVVMDAKVRLADTIANLPSSSGERQELLDYEAEITEIITKIKEKVGDGAVSHSALREMRKKGAQLSEVIEELQRDVQ